MLRTQLALACLLAILLPSAGAGAYRTCYLSGDLCADYDWNGGNAYAQVQTPHAIAGGGVYAGPEYEGYTVHLFSGSTYAYAYDGAWYGDDFTLVAVSASGLELVWFYQDTRVSDDPGAYHCTKIWPVYSRCSVGLLP